MKNTCCKCGYYGEGMFEKCPDCGSPDIQHYEYPSHEEVLEDMEE